MAPPRHLRIFLESGLRASAAAGGHNFIGKVVSVMAANGFTTEFCPDDDATLRRAEAEGGYTLTHMRPPVGLNGLVFRRVYHYPFWAIERSEQRWNWHVARSVFDPDQIDFDQATSFARFWRKKLFNSAQPSTGGQGFLYIPLQGRLTQHRSFQTCAPVQMIRTVLKADPRPVIATLHPRESYGPQDHAALAALAARFPRLTVTTGGMDHYLPGCDAVITQNSSVAFNGFLLHKPAILFADIDFHHIALRADADPVAALAELPRHRPCYDRYLFWFWQVMSINAGRPEVEARIATTLRRCGWPL